MKPTQNNKDARWREPDPGSAQKFITPEAERSMREGAGRYRVVKADGRAPRAGTKSGRKNPPTRAPKKQNVSLGDAVKAEVRERLSILGYIVTVDAEDIIKGLIAAGFIILVAMLQTTFFSRFRPFGAVPDIMLALVAGIAQSEGEKWGGACGLAGAFAVQALGGMPGTTELLPLLYMPVGYVIGILSGYYFSNSVPVRAMYIAGCGAVRAVITAVIAMRTLDTTIANILSGTVVPEFFSTALVAPAVYFLVYLSFKHFHKTRAERTERVVEKL